MEVYTKEQLLVKLNRGYRLDNGAIKNELLLVELPVSELDDVEFATVIPTPDRAVGTLGQMKTIIALFCKLTPTEIDSLCWADAAIITTQIINVFLT